MTITDKQREQVRTRGAVAIPDPYGLLDRYESRLEQLESATKWLLSAFEASLAGRPVRNADEIISFTQLTLSGESND